MDFAYDERTEELLGRLTAFMDSDVYPAESVLASQAADPAYAWQAPPVVGELKAKARSLGLWNLFLPDKRYGAGLTNLQYAPLAEVLGRSPVLAPAATNCAAPDTGNMELLSEFGTE
jgi:acyl-CoA dehydrogenase